MKKGKWLSIISESNESIIIRIHDKFYEYSSTPEVNKEFKKHLHNQGKALDYLKKNSIFVGELKNG